MMPHFPAALRIESLQLSLATFAFFFVAYRAASAGKDFFSLRRESLLQRRADGTELPPLRFTIRPRGLKAMWGNFKLRLTMPGPRHALAFMNFASESAKLVTMGAFCLIGWISVLQPPPYSPLVAIAIPPEVLEAEAWSVSVTRLIIIFVILIFIADSFVFKWVRTLYIRQMDWNGQSRQPGKNVINPIALRKDAATVDRPVVRKEDLLPPGGMSGK